MKLAPEILSKIHAWLDGPYDAKTKEEIRSLLASSPERLHDAFFQDLSFGTAGMRGVIGVGTNRLNIYTIRKATQGLANYLQKSFSENAVFIGFDVRRYSKEFAEETARVLAGNGIRVFLTKEICPTPLVSFGCRYFQANAAVMITASHNPPEYNGYKVYWKDGAQVVPPHDTGIIRAVENVHNIELAPLDSPLIHWVGTELDEHYLQALKTIQILPHCAADPLKIVYSPLHGTGIRIFTKALASWGFHHVHLVPKQSVPDANFSFAKKPNPEEKESLLLGMEEMQQTGADLLIATDPDADRVGVVEKEGTFFTGNQLAVLLIEHVCQSLHETGKFPKNAVFVKSIVTTELFAKIAKHHGGLCVNVLTGFKYIGEKIALWEKGEQYTYVFGAEESFGYLYGTFVRDKDAISTSCLIAEAATKAKISKRSLKDMLYALYERHGIHREKVVSLQFPEGEKGMQEMKAFLHKFRANPPKEFCGKQVTRFEDLLHGSHLLPPADVLRFLLEDGTKILIRPSGTEPKIKVYLEGVEPFAGSIEKQIASCDHKLATLAHVFKEHG